MGKVNTLISWAEHHPVRCALALFLFHFSISLAMYGIACSPYLASMHNGYGLWNFSTDSKAFHQWALYGVKLLREGGLSLWWHGDGTFTWGQISRYPHVRLISLCYFLFGSHPLSFAPVNALTWVATVFAAYALARVLMPNNRNMAVLGVAIFTLMPTYLLQTTQLLKDPLYTLGGSLFLLGSAKLLNGRLAWDNIVLIAVGMQLCVLLREYMLPAFALLCLLLVVEGFVRIPKGRAIAVMASSVLLGLVLWHLLETGGKIHLPGVATSFSFLDMSHWLNSIVQIIQHSRDAFEQYNAGSAIDYGVVLHNWLDGLRYAPRALQIGLFSPFPSDWFRPDSSSAWQGARLLAGVEMSVLYSLMVGFLLFLFRGEVSVRLRLFLLLFPLFFTLLLGMAIPIEGAIYRMRYAYLLPIVLGGVYGWSIMLGHRHVLTPSSEEVS